jgi:hypothetical protein
MPTQFLCENVEVRATYYCEQVRGAQSVARVEKREDKGAKLQVTEAAGKRHVLVFSDQDSDNPQRIESDQL